MLLRLGRWLRLLGQDVANPIQTSDLAQDKDLLRQAKREKRTLITRDRKLAGSCRNQKVKCILIKSALVPEQIMEMASIGIPLELNPQRCTLCNCPLQKVECMARMTWKCTGCKKLYWEGSHWNKMKKMLDTIASSI
jgi:uncharacterized protein with PIN domain